MTPFFSANSGSTRAPNQVSCWRHFSPSPRRTEPDGQVLRVDLDAELVVDHVGHPRPGPQVGREAMLGRLVGQPPAEDLLRDASQLGRPARGGAGRQTGDSPGAEGRHPA